MVSIPLPAMVMLVELFMNGDATVIQYGSRTCTCLEWISSICGGEPGVCGDGKVSGLHILMYWSNPTDTMYLSLRTHISLTADACALGIDCVAESCSATRSRWEMERLWSSPPVMSHACVGYLYMRAIQLTPDLCIPGYTAIG